MHTIGLRSYSALLAATALGSLAGFITPSAHAEFYAGASVGNATVDVDVNSFTVDEDDTAGKLILGYVFDLPVVDFSLETNLVDLGSAEANNARVEISGIDAFAVAGLDFGITGVFIKAGVIAWDTDAVLGTFSSSTDGNDSAYGIGLRFNLGSLFIRTEYEVFDIESARDVDLFSAGIVWRF